MGRSTSHAYRIKRLVLFVIICLSHSSMVPVFLNASTYCTYIVFSLASVSFIVSAMIYKRPISKTSVLIAIVLLANIFMTMLFNQDFRHGYYVVTMCIMTGLFISTVFEKLEFLNAYVTILVILAAFSLIATYILLPLTRYLGLTLPVHVNTNGVVYYNMGLATPILYPVIPRNTGIFLEPGMFQVFLSFALIFELFLVERDPKTFNIIVLALTSITTFSPVAYLQTVMLVVAFIARPKESGKSQSAKELIGIGLVLVATVLLVRHVPGFEESLAQGYYKLLHKQGSYQGRMGSIIANIKSGIESPFVGKGLTYGFQSTIEDWLGNITVHDTSTSTALFMIFGVSFPTIMLLLQYRLLSSNIGRVGLSIFVFAVSLISINAQLLIYNEIFYIIMFSIFMRQSQVLR